MRPPDIGHRIRDRAATSPNGPFLTLLFPDGPPTELSYAELVDRSERWTRAYRAAGLVPGARIVVVLRHSVDLYTAFIGALLGGFVPCYFAFPSEKFSRKEYFRTIGTLLNVAEAEALVTYPALRTRLADIGGAVPSLKQILVAGAETTDGFPPPRSGHDPAPAPSAADRAFLQFSSGTTGIKKGVAISHQALLWQIERYSSAIDLTGDDRIASWLPLYHDMGLIACLFLPLLTGTPLVAMSPFDWVSRPALLLHAVTRYRATLCWLPNFAYNFMASKVTDADLDGVDLSSLRGLVNCSEPILSSSHDAFVARFSGYGLRQEALAASYALAENTFAVTSTEFGRPPVVDEVDAAAISRGEALLGNGRHLVSSGRPLPGTELRILGADGKRLAERRVGEIVIASPCLFSEYLNNPSETERSHSGGAFRTGDLGYLADGELFVVGRLKDLIIIAGTNVYPQDIEAAVNGVEGVIPGRCVAFAVADEALGTDSLVIVAETAAVEPAERQPIARAVRERVVAATDLVPAEVRLVEHMWLRKSTAGKISRGLNRARYLKLAARETTPRPAHDPGRPGADAGASGDIVNRVRNCVLDVIGGQSSGLSSEIADDAPLLGGGIIDSLSYVNIVIAVEAELGVAFPREVLQAPERFDSIRKIADAISMEMSKLKDEAPTPANAAAGGSERAATAGGTNRERARAVRYALAPQFLDVEAQPYEWQAYIMRRGQAEYRSKSLSTDRLGFRLSLDRDGLLSYDRYMAAATPRGIVAGNSLAYGVGTTADDKTFANRLNAGSNSAADNGLRWYNFALRASTLTQERIATELFAPLDAHYFVWVSGINNLIALVVGEGDPANPAPFIGETIFSRTMMPGRAPRRCGGDLEARYRTMIAMAARDFHLLAAQRRATGCRILFCMQPALAWIDKTLTPQEQVLVDIFDAAGLTVQQAHHPRHLGRWRERYCQDLGALCRQYGIDFVDLNRVPRFAGAEWLFLDRTHLTDLGHDVVAEVIRAWL